MMPRGSTSCRPVEHPFLLGTDQPGRAPCADRRGRRWSRCRESHSRERGGRRLSCRLLAAVCLKKKKTQHLRAESARKRIPPETIHRHITGLCSEHWWFGMVRKRSTGACHAVCTRVQLQQTAETGFTPGDIDSERGSQLRKGGARYESESCCHVTFRAPGNEARAWTG